MSEVYQPPSGGARGSYEDAYADDAGSGWVIFAGVMLMIVGVLNVIYGIAAIDKANFYVADTDFVISELSTWGWILVVVGAIQCLVAVGVWLRNQLARWVGVLVAAVNAILELLFLPAYPFLSLALFTLSLLVVFGLLAHGGRVSWD
jgi:hypothetical protein